ncbi:MAG TPA: hypothetical protein VMG37_15790 [Solirubrobacteraceae bacterium]|nr:hypothetical protein [Solirubrobacteraceae bacterium]
MSQKLTFDVGLRFTVDDALPPARNALHAALQSVHAVTVVASSAEEAEAQVDQIRVALERAADQRHPWAAHLLFE